MQAKKVKTKHPFITDDTLQTTETLQRHVIMSSNQFLDELVREYLLYRGLVSSLKAFDAEIKTEKEKGLRSDK